MLCFAFSRILGDTNFNLTIMIKSIYSLAAISAMAFLVSCEDDFKSNLIPIPAPEPKFVDISHYYDQPAFGRTSQPQYGIYMAEYLTAGETLDGQHGLF